MVTPISKFKKTQQWRVNVEYRKDMRLFPYLGGGAQWADC